MLTLTLLLLPPKGSKLSKDDALLLLLLLIACGEANWWFITNGFALCQLLVQLSFERAWLGLVKLFPPPLNAYGFTMGETAVVAIAADFGDGELLKLVKFEFIKEERMSGFAGALCDIP